MRWLKRLKNFSSLNSFSFLPSNFFLTGFHDYCLVNYCPTLLSFSHHGLPSLQQQPTQKHLYTCNPIALFRPFLSLSYTSPALTYWKLVADCHLEISLTKVGLQPWSVVASLQDYTPVPITGRSRQTFVIAKTLRGGEKSVNSPNSNPTANTSEASQGTRSIRLSILQPLSSPLLIPSLNTNVPSVLLVMQRQSQICLFSP